MKNTQRICENIELGVKLHWAIMELEVDNFLLKSLMWNNKPQVLIAER